MTEQLDEHQPKSTHCKHKSQAFWLEMLLVHLQWLIGYLSVDKASVFIAVISNVYSVCTLKVHSDVEIQLNSVLPSQLIH